jgi:NADH dehydrogenase FAD-containing subunit
MGRGGAGLKRIEDATRIRRRILIAFERAELATDAVERQRLLTFAIVGGGATGVEMAGAISRGSAPKPGNGFPPHRFAADAVPGMPG